MQAGGFDRSDLWEAATGSRSSKPEAGAAAFCLRYITRLMAKKGNRNK